MNIEDLHSHFESFYPTFEDDEYMEAYKTGDIDTMFNCVSPCHDKIGCCVCEEFIDDE